MIAPAREQPSLSPHFVFATGETTNPSTRSLLQGRDIRHLEKPFTPEAVLCLVGSLLA